MEIAERAVVLATKLGATYADARLERTRGESILVKDGKVERVTSERAECMGVRVFLGTWGFASTTNLTKQAVGRAVEAAIGMAKATKRAAGVRLARAEIARARTRVRCEVDPFEVDLAERIELCLEADRRARVDGSVKRTSAGISTGRIEKAFVSSEGARIEQTNTLTYAGVFALAKRGSVVEYYDDLAGGSGGFEVVRKFDMQSAGERVGKKASELARAKTLPKLKLPVVLDPDFVSLLAHEIIGHPSEADRVLGREAAWAGTTWWADKLGKRIGSSLLNAVDDPKFPGALGFYEYDDEGVRGRRKQLIREGVLTEHMHNRETALEFGVQPNGNMRAQGPEYLPLIRMSNTYVEPGEHEVEELFEIPEGVYLKGAKIPSIDSRRYNFQLSAKEASLIERGELRGPFRDASFQGIAPDFFASIDAVARDFEMRPIPNCGKGDPMQTLHVGNGGPHLRGIGLVVGTR